VAVRSGIISEVRARRAARVVAIRVIVAVVLGVVTTVTVAWGSAAGTTLAAKTFEWDVVQLHDGSTGPMQIGVVEVSTLTASRRACDCYPSFSDFFDIEFAAMDLASACRALAATVPVRDGSRDRLLTGWGLTIQDILVKAAANGRRATWLGDARGWPKRALWCEITVTSSTPAFGVEGGLALSDPAKARILTFRALPYRPIWSGLVIDSACFGGAWSVLLLFRPVRAWLRARRGHCPRCNYSLAPSGGAAAGCPECGWGR
jgi:hypothetical protein